MPILLREPNQFRIGVCRPKWPGSASKSFAMAGHYVRFSPCSEPLHLATHAIRNEPEVPKINQTVIDVETQYQKLAAGVLQ